MNYPGLIAAWSAEGKTNDDLDRDILKDLTGNGHDITLNGFSFSEMSGYGGYLYNWLSKEYANNTDEGYGFYKTSTKLIITNCNTAKRSPLFKGISNEDKYRVYVKVSGLTEETDLYFGKVDNLQYCKKLHNGINDFIVDFMPEIGNWGGFGFYSFLGECNITIEQLPLYPDSLVFDGVNDYCRNHDIPIINDYTIIVKREWIDIDSQNKAGLATNGSSTNNLFTFEYKNGTSYFTYSKGKLNEISKFADRISFQTTNNYNGQPILNGETLGGGGIIIGQWSTELNGPFKGAFYSAYLFDRSLDEQEIKVFICKYIDPEYILPSEIPTPDCYYDFSQGSNDDETRDTIKDLSGNGNDATAHNFAWNEEGSGYKDGALYFDGVDDYVSLDAFDSGLKTIFMLVKNADASYAPIYEQRKIDSNGCFSIEQAVGISQNKGEEYFNQIKRTSSTRIPIGKFLITAINGFCDETTSTIPLIGTGFGFWAYWRMHSSIYKFLGFKEALTEEQIQYVIKKYNLLDGVDEIEVN